MWIGVTGRNGSGKDTVAQILEQHGYISTTASDFIREQVRLRNLPVTRRNIQIVVEDMRSKDGPDVLIQMIIKKYDQQNNVVVCSLRHPQEVETLKAHKPFVLLFVDTDATIRFKRSLERQRENAPTTFEKFLEEEHYEAEQADKRYFDMIGVEKMAEYTIHNNGTFEDLKAQVEAFFTTIQTQK